MEQPNMSYINSLSGGDKEFEARLIAIIKSEFPEEKSIYYANIETNKYQDAAENVHKLKHKISILGLEKSYEIAVLFENNLKESKTEGKDEFDLILKNITSFLMTI